MTLWFEIEPFCFWSALPHFGPKVSRFLRFNPHGDPYLTLLPGTLSLRLLRKTIVAGR